MEITPDNIVQFLPLVATGITALIVFVKRGVTVDIDTTELKEDVKEMNNKLTQAILDIAVLKEKFRSIRKDD
jgi:hypothetical protein